MTEYILQLKDYTISQNQNIKYSFGSIPPKFKKVDDYLIRGSSPTVVDIFKLKKEGVNQIYDFRHKCFRGMKFIEKLACKIAGIKYCRQPYSFLQGTLPTLEEYETIAKSVKENGEKGGITLFHCNSGYHRTALMTAFYSATKGDTVERCFSKNKTEYFDNVIKSVKTQVIDSHYFKRTYKTEKTINPIKYFKNEFNNRVVIATKNAYDDFLELIRYPKL